MIDNGAEGCGECNFDKWGNLVLCPKCKKKQKNEKEQVGKYRWFCKICKKLAEKDSKKGLVGRYLLSSMLWYDSEEEVIKHIKNKHPKEYKKVK